MVPQVVELLGGKLEHEIVRKPIAIPFDRAVQRLGFDLVERRQIIVQNDLMTPQQQDGLRDALHGNNDCSLP